jgi:hypothetical protein
MFLVAFSKTRSTFSIQWIISNTNRFVLPQNRLFQVNSWILLFVFSNKNESQIVDISRWGVGRPTPRPKLGIIPCYLSDRTSLIIMKLCVPFAICSSKADQAGWFRDCIWDMSGWTLLWQKRCLDWDSSWCFINLPEKCRGNFLKVATIRFLKYTQWSHPFTNLRTNNKCNW